MALRHSKSQPSVCSEVDLFSLPPTDTSVDSSLYAEYSPLTNIQDSNAKIEYRITPTNLHYYDLLDSFIILAFKLVTPANANLVGGEDVSVCNNFLHSIFSDVELTLQNQPTTSSTTRGCYAYKAYFETLFKQYFQNKTNLENALFVMDNDEFKLADSNTGYKTRKEYCGGSELKELSGRLFLDLADQERFILNGMDMTITLTRNKDDFFMLAPKSNLTAAPVAAKLKINDCKLYIRKHVLFPSISLSHQKLLEMNNLAQYPTIDSQITTFTIPKGNQTFSEDNIYHGAIPSRIIIGIVDNGAFVGDLLKNPFAFNHHKVSSINLMVNNISVPSRTIDTDFTKSLFQKSYQLLNNCVSKMNGNRGLPFEKNSYGKGNTFFGFDIFPLDLVESTLHLERQGSTKLEIGFSTALADAVTLILYSESQRVITIDKDRKVSSQ